MLTAGEIFADTSCAIDRRLIEPLAGGIHLLLIRVSLNSGTGDPVSPAVSYLPRIHVSVCNYPYTADRGRIHHRNQGNRGNQGNQGNLLKSSDGKMFVCNRSVSCFCCDYVMT